MRANYSEALVLIVKDAATLSSVKRFWELLSSMRERKASFASCINLNPIARELNPSRRPEGLNQGKSPLESRPVAVINKDLLLRGEVKARQTLSVRWRLAPRVT